MVDSEQQHVGIHTQVQQGQPQQWIVAQVEGPAGMLLGVAANRRGLLVGRQRAQVDDPERVIGFAPVDDGLAAGIADVHPQAQVARGELAQRRAQRRLVQGAVKAERRADGVGGRRTALQLGQKPQALLGERQHRRGVAAPGLDRRQVVAALAVIQRRRLIAQHRVLEHNVEWQVYGKTVADPRHQLGRQQRMPAQLEEVVVPTDGLALEHATPQARQQLFGGGQEIAGGAVASALGSAGRRRRSSLPLGVSGSSASTMNWLGTR